MYDIESIQALYSNKAVEYSQHFRNRMKERNIKFADVRMAIQSGEIFRPHHFGKRTIKQERKLIRYEVLFLQRQKGKRCNN